MDLWAASLLKHGDHPPYANVKDMLCSIDATVVGGTVKWEHFTVGYTGEVDNTSPGWMRDQHEVWFRDPRLVLQEMLANPDFDSEFEYVPVREFVGGIERRYTDYMTGDAVWRHAVSLITSVFFTCLHTLLLN